MSRSGIARACALVTVVGTITLGVGTAPANAALTLRLPGLLGSGPAAPGPVTPATGLTGLLTQTTGALGSLLTNQIGLGTVAETVACPVAKTLAQLPPPGTPGVSESVFVACVLHFLDFEWRTTHPGPPVPLFDNNVVTTLGVPTPLNLDSDPLPEAVGVVLVLAPNKFQLSFHRTDLGLKGDLPSSAELVITDPTGGSLPRSHIGIGLDSYGGRFPDNLSVTFTLESYKPPIDFSGPPRFRVDVNATQQTQRAAITADLFDENATSTVRDSFVRADVGMKPVPSTLAATVATRTDDGIDADVQTSSTQPLLSLPGLLNVNFALGPKVGPPTVDAKVAIRQKADVATGERRVQRLTAKLTDLPGWMGLRYRPIKPSTPAGPTPEQIDKARGGQTVDYAASSTLNALEVSYDDVVQRPGAAPDKPSLRAHLQATSIPPGIGVSQIGSFTSFNAIDNGIGRIEGEFALNGELIQRRTDRPGLRLLAPKAVSGQPQQIAIAARIDGLRRAAFDNLGGRMVGDVGIAQQPFDVDLREGNSGITATANIEDLPANAKFQFLPAQPASDEAAGGVAKPLRVRYDAGDHAIGLIKFKAAFDKTMAEHLDQIEGRITDLPPVIDVNADLQGKVYEFNANKPFGAIEALARNKKAVADATVPPLSDGVTGVSAIIKDDGTFAAQARVLGLKNVKADLGLNKYHVEAGAVPLEVRALVDEVRGTGPSREVLPRQMVGTIDKLPGRIDLQFDQQADEKVITYDADAAIHAISLQLTGPKLYAPEPKVNKVRATAFDVPSTFTAHIGDTGKLDLTAGPGIGGIEALATSGPDPTLTPGHHAAYVEKGKDVVVKAQLFGFKHFKLDPEPIDVVFETAKSLPLDVEAKADLVPDPDQVPESEAHLHISNVPTKIAAHYERTGKIHYEANDGAPGGRIDSIRANGTFYETRGADHLKRDASAVVEGIPSRMDAAIGLDDPDHKTIAYDANGRTDHLAAEVTGDKLYEKEARINKLTASVDGIPKTLNATLDANGAMDLDGGTGIDDIRALVTDGADPALPAGKHAANVQYNAGGVHAKVHLLGFKHFTLVPDPIKAVLDTAQSKALHLDANVDEKRGTEALNRVGTLDISAVPSHVSVAVEDLKDAGVDAKHIGYHASSNINTIDLRVDGPKLYADQPKINRLEAHVAGIPSNLDAYIGSGTKLRFDADQSITSIEALATSGPNPSFTAGSHGAYVETGANVVAKARLLGFKQFVLLPDPLDVTFATDTDHPLELGAKLDWDKNGIAELTGTAHVKNVPATMHFKAGSDGSYLYDGSSRIAAIDLDAHGLPDVPQLPAKIEHAHVDIAGVPRHLEGGYASNGRIHFKGTTGPGSSILSAVDKIDVGAETASPPALPTGLATNNVSYRQKGAAAAAHATITGLREIDVLPTPLDALVDTNVLQALDVNAAQDANADGVDEKAITAQLRSGITRVHVKDQMAAAGRQITADTGTPLGTLDVDAKADNLPLGIKTAKLHLENLPEYLKVGFPSGTDVIDAHLLRRDVNGDLVPDARGIGLLDLSINNGAPRSEIVNRAGNTVASDGVFVNLLNGDLKNVGLHLHGLRGVTYGTSPYTKIGLDVEQSQAKPVALDAFLDDKLAVGHIDKLPANMLLELSPKDDVPIRYQADNSISEITVNTNYAKDFGIPGAHVTVLDAPKKFAVCFRSDGKHASCMPSNRFDGDTDKKISAAYESDVTTTGPKPRVKILGCFDDPNCVTGRKLTADVSVPRRLEIEAGANATGPSADRFDCFDVKTDITNVFSQIGCMIDYPGKALGQALDRAGVHAFLWFDTGAEDLGGTASYSIPSPVSFLDQPITLSMVLPTINANRAFLDADLKLAKLNDPITMGGTLQCHGGSLGLSSHFHASLGEVDIPNGVTSFVNGIVDTFNSVLPEKDQIPHVQDPLPLGSIDKAIDFSLLQAPLC